MARKREKDKAGTTKKADHTPRPGSLHTISKIQLELGRVYRDARTGVIKVSEATKLTYILLSMSKIIEAHELEKRLKSLEGRLEQINEG